jgi:hypothetical protein
MPVAREYVGGLVVRLILKLTGLQDVVAGSMNRVIVSRVS